MFEDHKHRIMKILTLKLLEYDRFFEVQANASNFSIEGDFM